MDKLLSLKTLKHSYQFVGAVFLSELARGFGETVGTKTGIAEVVGNRMAVIESEVDPVTRATIFNYAFPSIDGKLDVAEIAHRELQGFQINFEDLPLNLQVLEPIGAEYWYDNKADTWQNISQEERMSIYQLTLRDAKFDLLTKQANIIDDQTIC